MTEKIEKRFTWEYSHYDSTGEIHDWVDNRCLITDCLQKWELEEWCQELNQIVDENDGLNKDLKRIVREHQHLQMKFQRLQKENEQLKKQNENLQNLTDALERQLKICEYGDFKYE